MELQAGGSLYELDELDPDIRSIMEANDGLVRQLAGLVDEGDLSDGSLDAEQGQEEGVVEEEEAEIGATGHNVARLQHKQFDDLDLDADEEPDYELGQLEELVRKTIEDYANRFNFVQQQQQQQQPDERHRISSVGEPFYDGTNEPFANNTNAELLIERNETNPSWQPLSGAASGPTEARSRRSSSGRLSAKAAKRLNKRTHDDGDSNRLCIGDSIVSDKDKPVQTYENCNEMPECESGGQCVVEELTKSNSNGLDLDLDRQSRLANQANQINKRRARCRCPIGRGGQLCQKRKWTFI